MLGLDKMKIPKFDIGSVVNVTKPKIEDSCWIKFEDDPEYNMDWLDGMMFFVVDNTEPFTVSDSKLEYGYTLKCLCGNELSWWFREEWLSQ